EDNTLKLLVNQRKHSPVLKDELETILGRKVVLCPEDAGLIERLLQKIYPRAGISNGGSAEQNRNVRFNVNDAAFLDLLVREAKTLNSSDIHIETYAEK